MKITLFCALIMLLVAPGHVGAATFSGRILNGTRDSSAVAGQSVALHYFRAEAHAPQEMARMNTQPDGLFEFSITKVDTSAHYLATTEYQGVAYYSEPAHFSDSQSFHYDIVIFDSTHNASGVMGLMHHLFLQDTGEGLAVRETRVLNNPTAKTILNAVNDGDERGALLRIELVPWTQNITPIAGRFGSDLVVHDHRLYDVGVFEPGNRQFSFVYELPWQKDRATLVVQVEHMTRSVDFFLGDQGLILQGEELNDHGPFTIRGATYHRYGLSDVPPGTRLQLEVLRQSTASDALPPHYTLVAVGALFLLGLSLTRAFSLKRINGLNAQKRDELLKERKALIQNIARMEASSSFSSDTAMQQERSLLFEKLLHIETRLQSAVKKTGKK